MAFQSTTAGGKLLATTIGGKLFIQQTTVAKILSAVGEQLELYDLHAEEMHAIDQQQNAVSFLASGNSKLAIDTMAEVLQFVDDKIRGVDQVRELFAWRAAFNTVKADFNDSLGPFPWSDNEEMEKFWYMAKDYAVTDLWVAPPSTPVLERLEALLPIMILQSMPWADPENTAAVLRQGAAKVVHTIKLLKDVAPGAPTAGN